MRLPDPQRLRAQLDGRLLPAPPLVSDVVCGKVTEVGPTLLRASLPGARLGALCRLEPGGIEAEVVGVQGEMALLSPFAEPLGCGLGSLVRSLARGYQVAVGPHLLGTVVDGLGRPLAGARPAADCAVRPLEASAPDPLTRQLIDTPLPLGVRAIDALLTCGRGQRMGIFAAAGGGKSTLMGMLCDGEHADVIVIALIGERGREVREFLECTLSPAARQRAVVVVATSDRPAAERLKAAYTATAIAEYFRDQGQHVLLMMDSLTRFARAAREIGLAAGEPPMAGGFPPSLYARLPRLLERAGPAARGSITGFYTVLVEGDNLNEPVTDEVRSIVDGHIVLSRKLAEAGHYPAIDVGASISRVMDQIVSPEQRTMASQTRRLLARYQEIELLVRVGEYQRGQDSETDEALDRRDALNGFLRQAVGERTTFADTLSRLGQAVGG